MSEAAAVLESEPAATAPEPAPQAIHLGLETWTIAEALGVDYVEVWSLQHAHSYHITPDLDRRVWVFTWPNGTPVKEEPFGARGRELQGGVGCAR